VKVYVRYLRRKLNAEGEPDLIHAVRGVGYVLREPRSSDDVKDSGSESDDPPEVD
jgi:DNA-binding winged helix-turn-helix (wHTH) protein